MKSKSEVEMYRAQCFTEVPSLRGPRRMYALVEFVSRDRACATNSSPL